MRLTGHLAASLPLGLVVGLVGKSWPAAAAAMALSVLVDLDHLADYVYWRRGWRSVADFFATNRAHRVQRLLLLLHSWELIPPVAALLWLLAGPLWATALAGAWAYHLVLDHLFNPVAPGFYLLAVRLNHGYSRGRLADSGLIARVDTAAGPE